MKVIAAAIAFLTLFTAGFIVGLVSVTNKVIMEMRGTTADCRELTGAKKGDQIYTIEADYIVGIRRAGIYED